MLTFSRLIDAAVKRLLLGNDETSDIAHRHARTHTHTSKCWMCESNILIPIIKGLVHVTQPRTRLKITFKEKKVAQETVGTEGGREGEVESERWYYRYTVYADLTDFQNIAQLTAPYKNKTQNKWKQKQNPKKHAEYTQRANKLGSVTTFHENHIVK